MFTEVKAPSSRRVDSTSEWEWPSPVDPPATSHFRAPEPSTPKIDIAIANKEPPTPTPQQQPSGSKFPLDPKENTTKSKGNSVTAPGILLRGKSFKSKIKTTKVPVRGASSGDKENQGAKEGKGADVKIPWVLIKTDSEGTRESEKEHDITKEKT